MSDEKIQLFDLAYLDECKRDATQLEGFDAIAVSMPLSYAMRFEANARLARELVSLAKDAIVVLEEHMVSDSTLAAHAALLLTDIQRLLAKVEEP